MSEPVTIIATQAAQLLGLATETFYRWVTAAKRDHGFPPPIPGGRRYSRQAVLDWINRGGLPAPASHNPAMEPDVAACEAVLLKRARAMLAAE